LTDDGFYTYNYDCENHLTDVNDINDQKVASYVYDVEVATFDYDALGRRIRKVDSKASETTLYYYNEDWQVLAEYDGSGVFQKMNVFGNYIDELLYRRGTFLPSRRFYVHDHLYSPVVSIAADGTTVSERYEYDAYGHCTIWDYNFTTQRTEPADTVIYPNPYLFTGRRIDYLDGGNLPLMYYRNRSYDTYTGRFLQHDPLGINPNGGYLNPFMPFFQYTDGMNLYNYVENNPIIFVDPFGLKRWYPPGATCLEKCKIDFEYDVAQCGVENCGGVNVPGFIVCWWSSYWKMKWSCNPDCIVEEWWP